MATSVGHRFTTIGLLCMAGSISAQTVTCPQPLPQVCSQARAQLQILTRNTSQTCNLNANTSDSGNCPTFTITVIPATEPDKACVAVVPYSSLTATGAKQNKRLSWAMDTQAGQLGYKFKQADGIVLVPPTTPATAPPDVWYRSKTARDRKSVEIKVKKQEKADWCHYPQVVDAQERLCCPIDPVISNDPN